MTDRRTCRYRKCHKLVPVTARADAEFCDERCRSKEKYERRKDTASITRVLPASGGVGSRGGNVRSVAEARELQSASKDLDRWRLVMEQQVFHTLFSTGYFHVDDLDCLDLPAAAFEVRGTLVNRIRAKGWMERTGVDRKVAHKAANARKAPIYRISAKGRKELPTLVGDSAGEVGASSDPCAVSGESCAIGRDQAQRAKPGPVDATGSGASPESSTLVGVGKGNASESTPCGTDASGHLPHSGEKESTGVPRSKGSGGVTHVPPGASADQGSEGVSSASSSPSEPARLPGFEESAAARNLRDAA